VDLQLTREEEGFRAHVRAFFKLRSGQRLTRADHVSSQQALQSRGWLGVSWPVEFGGPGWSATQRYLFEEELERAGAPNLIPMGVIYLGPVLIAFGTAEQQARWLPDILSSRSLWAQGYSEPDAGSDLAALGLNAVRDGDCYVLNGTKIWTSLAHWADWIFCLVRTSREARRQEGISFVCVDMKSPGIKVDPIITMNGAWELNRVMFHDVRVPCANCVGEEGKAWHYANVLLRNERLSYAHIGRKKADLTQLRRLAASSYSDSGGSLLDDPLFAAKLAALEIEISSLEISVLRALTGEWGSTAVAALKIKCTECAQHVTELCVELAGRNICPFPDRSGPDWRAALLAASSFGPVCADAYLFERAQTIYGGSTEIQKNVLWREIGR
jgi:alkylation response protein AidB-like acyl-CoA dehydrogenase